MREWFYNSLSFFFFIFVLVAFFSLITFFSNNDDRLDIVFLGVFSGEERTYGSVMRNSALLAVKEINRENPNNNINLILRNGQCSREVSKKIINRLLKNDYKFIIGGSCSDETLPVLNAVKDEDVLVFTPGATADNLSRIAPYFFRNVPSDGIVAISLSDRAIKDGHKNISIYFEDHVYTDNYANLVRDNLENNGIEILSYELINERGFLSRKFPQNFNKSKIKGQIINDIKGQKPDAIFIITQSNITSDNFIKELKVNDIDDITLYTNSVVDSDNFTASEKSLLNNVVSVLVQLEESDRSKDFIEKYQAEYKKKPTVPFFAAASYDAVYILWNAISSVGDDPALVADYIRENSFDGVLGEYGFDDIGNVIGIESVFIIEYGNGEPKEIL